MPTLLSKLDPRWALELGWVLDSGPYRGTALPRAPQWRDDMFGSFSKISKLMESNLIWIVSASIIAGVAFGSLFPNQAKGLKALSTLALFVMLYPMMIGLRIEEVGKAVSNLRLIGLSLLFNFLLSPLLAAGLARLLLHDRPDFAVGLILTGTVPCAGMVAGWTGYAKRKRGLGIGISGPKPSGEHTLDTDMDVRPRRGVYRHRCLGHVQGHLGGCSDTTHPRGFDP